MTERVLVTGATGQIGNALALALRERGAEVRCLVRSAERAAALAEAGLELVQGDVTAPETLEAAVTGVSQVVHLAGAISYEEKDRAWQEAVNVEGTRDLLAAAAAAGVQRVLFTSSIASLGWVEGDGVGDEQTAFNWGPDRIPYFDTKHAAEQLVLQDKRLEGVAVCPGIVLGPGDTNRNGGQVLERLAAGELPGFPTGATTVATLADVVDGHLAALERGRRGERYVLGGSTLSFEELFSRLAAVVGASAPTRRLPAWLLQGLARVQALGHSLGGPEPRVTPSLVRITSRNRRYSSQKAEDELGYQPRSLEEGAEACWAWLLANPKS